MPTVWTGFRSNGTARLLANPKITRIWLELAGRRRSRPSSQRFIGTLLALGVERSRPVPARDALLFAPMIIPDIVLAIALLSFFTLLKFSLGCTPSSSRMSCSIIAFVCAVVRARLKSPSTGR
jgi:spermidine/putrescine transport system permease protein